MSDGNPVSRILVPPGLFRVYLAETGLLPRFRMLLARARETRRTIEGCCDTALEIEALICGSPPPEGLREYLRDLFGPLGPDILLRTSPEDPGSAETALFPARSAAEALDSLRRAWAWFWTPGAIRAGRLPEEPGTVEAISAAYLPPGKRSWFGTGGVPERGLPGPDPEELGRALDRTEALLSDRVPADPAVLEEARESLVLVRYKAGEAYNRAVGAQDPFEFLVRIDSPVSEDPGPDALLGLVRRSFELEERLAREEGRSTESNRAEDLPLAGTGIDDSESGLPLGSAGHGIHAARVRQVTGTPSSPGRASGTAVRWGSEFSESGRVGGGSGMRPADGSPTPVLFCDRLTRDLLAAFPDATAAAERDGGRIGLGARRARTAGLPCVSGIRDLDQIPEGARVWVDGDLGILSLESVR